MANFCAIIHAVVCGEQSLTLKLYGIHMPTGAIIRPPSISFIEGQMKNIIALTFWMLLSIMSTSSAVAAPFCSVHWFGKQCFYYSMKQCRQTGNHCIINQDELSAPSGSAPFCVVQSFGTQCFYYNADSCIKAAKSNGGTCVYKDKKK